MKQEGKEDIRHSVGRVHWPFFELCNLQGKSRKEINKQESEVTSKDNGSLNQR